MHAALQAKNDSNAVQANPARTATQEQNLVDRRSAAETQRRLAEQMNSAPRVLQRQALSNAIHDSSELSLRQQRREALNATGLPHRLKSGIESLSAMSMGHVKVHYNSDKPAQLQARAYAQGSEIHVAPGQEQHVPHEAWHLVQQAQGRVKPTLQARGGVDVNDDPALEREADQMGTLALSKADAGLAATAEALPTTHVSGAPAGTVLQRMPLELPHPHPGNKELWQVDTRKPGKEYLKNWIDSAAQSNLPALDLLIQQLTTIEQRDPLESYLLLHARVAYAQGRALIDVPGARYIPGSATFSTLEDIPPDSTLIMRSINTGDMYQVRASMVLHPDFKLLIWNVTPQARAQASMAAAVIGAPDRVFYTDCPVPPAGYAKSETWTTSDIESSISGDMLFTPRPKKGKPKNNKRPARTPKTENLANANFARLAGDKGALAKLLPLLDGGAAAGQTLGGNDFLHWLKAALGKLKNDDPGKYGEAQEVYRRFRIADLANKYAPYTPDQATAFEKDLQGPGRFGLATGPCVIVNFRDTGHSARPGANAPALDTGVTGVQQISTAIREKLKGVQIVPMGEKPENMRDRPNLLKYWEWPSVQKSRLDQTLLLKYLKDRYDVVGAVGMRSGVMDQLALLGIPIVSIDISPHRGLADGQLPDLATSKGWDRGLKLEDSYKRNYGHAFIEHERVDEKRRNLKNWKGEFHEKDIATIADAVEFYLGDHDHKADSDNYRHRSHPLHPAQIRKGLDHLVGIMRTPKGINAYAVIDHLRPYVNQLKNLVTSARAQDATSLESLLTIFEAQIEGIINKAENGQAKTIKWMRDNQKQALLKGDRGNRWYREQSAWITAAFGMGPAQRDEAVERYKALDNHYRQPVDTNALSAIYRLVEAVERLQALMAYVETAQPAAQDGVQPVPQ